MRIFIHFFLLFFIWFTQETVLYGLSYTREKRDNIFKVQFDSVQETYLKKYKRPYKKIKGNIAYFFDNGNSMDQFTVALYIPKSKKIKNELFPYVIIVPNVLGETLLERRIAHMLAKSGIASILIEKKMQSDLIMVSKKIEDLNPLLRISTMRIKTAIDYIHFQHRDILDSNHIGIFGVSLGAYRSAIALGVDERIDAGVLFVGGDGLADMLNSNQYYAKQIRKKLMKSEGIRNIKTFIAKVRDSLSFEPGHFASFRKKFGPNSVKMYVAVRDRKIPTINQIDLAEKFGSPVIRFLNTGHTVGALRSLVSKKGIISHFLNIWKLKMR